MEIKATEGGASASDVTPYVTYSLPQTLYKAEDARVTSFACNSSAGISPKQGPMAQRHMTDQGKPSSKSQHCRGVLAINHRSTVTLKT